MTAAPKSLAPEYFRQVKEDGHINIRPDFTLFCSHEIVDYRISSRIILRRNRRDEGCLYNGIFLMPPLTFHRFSHGPHDVDKISFDEMPPNFDVKGILSVTLRFAPFSKKIRLQRTKNADTDEEQNFCKALMQAFSPAILLDKYPKSQIDLHINVLEDDGNILSSAIIASTLALIDAGIELYDVIIGASCSISNDNSLLLDPSSVEDAKADATVTIAFMPSLNQVALTYQTGIFDPRLLIKNIPKHSDIFEGSNPQKCVKNKRKSGLLVERLRVDGSPAA
uniref:Exoribonuclease phosphorolytic domain-containing protein n=1 Tax=Romanomermis culicivorax TaxID=13658 RepID=A0A915I0Q8_ROMCU